jgi:hypothetical protein
MTASDGLSRLFERECLPSLLQRIGDLCIRWYLGHVPQQPVHRLRMGYPAPLQYRYLAALLQVDLH